MLLPLVILITMEYLEDTIKWVWLDKKSVAPGKMGVVSDSLDSSPLDDICKRYCGQMYNGTDTNSCNSK